MSQLSQENIVLIDTYLKNSMVVYADIRMEMVDHVASEIEIKISHGDKRPFHDIFKEYMALNRLRLLDSNSRTVSRLTKELAKKAFNKVLEVQYIFGFVFSIVFYFISIEVFDLVKATWIHLMLNLSLILGLTFVYEYHRRKNKIPRLSGIERLGVLLCILVQVVFFTFNIKSLYIESLQLIYAIVFSAQFMITIAFLKLGVEQYRAYRNRFYYR